MLLTNKTKNGFQTHKDHNRDTERHAEETAGDTCQLATPAGFGISPLICLAPAWVSFKQWVCPLLALC